MKILELRFKNLNSLYGGWHIDFTDPAFTADGLFAITGATGSGKTTILDALCLALYGQTPRLGKMTQGANEVMSRQTGECFAEVLFETARGTYRAAWHQHRSRRKAGGALQAPKREIAQADGTLLAEKQTEVQRLIDEITGMSFDRFTRSILLAQGSFDTFLKASADERSPILEQITGTEIYTEISKAVHQRASAENQTLKELKAGLSGMALLDAEALEQIELDLKAVKHQYAAEAAKREAAKAALDCAARIETLNNELEANRAEQEEWRRESEAFRPEAERLAAAKRAVPPAVEHARLVHLRTSLSQIENRLSTAVETLPGLAAKQADAGNACEAAELRLQAADAAQREWAPILKQARELDTRITERTAALDKDRTELMQRTAALAKLRETEIQKQEELTERQQRMQAAEAYQAAHAQDADLVGQLAALLQSLEQLTQLSQTKETAGAAADKAESAAGQAAAHAEAAQNKRTAAQRAADTAAAALKQISGKLTPLLDGKSAAEWRSRFEALRQRTKIEQRIHETRGAIALKTTEASKAEQALEQKKTELQALQREQALMLENLRLQQKIESLEAERKGLVDGRPCPLCGALEHPYAAGLPAPETGSMETLNASLTALAGQIDTLNRQQATAEAACETLGAALARDEAELKTLPPARKDEAENTAARIEEIELLELAFTNAKTALDEARETLNLQSLAEQKAAHTAEAAAEQSSAAKLRLTEAETAWAAAEKQLRQQLKPYDVPLAPETAAQLTARRGRWTDAEKQTGELRQTISQQQAALENLTEQIRMQEEDLQQQADALDRANASIESLKAEREKRFGDRQPDLVEQELQNALEAERTAHTAAQNRLAECRQALETARRSIASLEADKAENKAQLQQAETSFADALARAGFESEAAWLDARLDAAELPKLEMRADELAQRHTRLAALEAEKTQQLAAARKQAHIETSPEEHAALSRSCNELQQRIGGLKDQLKADEKNRALYAERLGGIEKQQAECGRWNQLHELIGSADGKKFRNFAQGLTFELMVSHANRQLAKMSDRYLLVRDKEYPLDLNVVDNYQAGEIRPVKNLSGGESFVVSLSLALGLSSMASKTIRVDSLFLDEGFGTLDEDALETALEALAELKQDGKLIGVISHVSAMKERIGTQINVETASGGRSRLCGAGVSTLQQRLLL